jgi:hypothetical protein
MQLARIGALLALAVGAVVVVIMVGEETICLKLLLLVVGATGVETTTREGSIEVVGSTACARSGCE